MLPRHTLARSLVAVAAVAAATLLPVAGEPPARAADGPAANSVSAWGSAPHLGPGDGLDLAAPLVDIARAGRPGSDGYWLVAADGGVFAYGDAGFFGSAAGTLVSPAVGIAARPAGEGYWLAAADGGVFAFGGAEFHGSMGDVALNQPIVGVAADPAGDGYWLAAADGGVFAFGDAPFYGSMGNGSLPAPVAGLAPSPDGLGYWLAGENGQVYPFGVTDEGSPADDGAGGALIAGIAAHSADGYWFAVGQRPPLGVEDRGPDVRRLQERLAELGYWVGPIDGVYTGLTEQAVYAFQKVEGLAATGEATADVRAALDGARRPQARGDGDLLEVDKTRQVLFVVRQGVVVYAFNTSTGTEEPYTYKGRRYLADTPNGDWEIFWEVDGYRTSDLGRLYRPKYFHEDGIAVHGYSFVPPYPASHGCVRVTNPAIDFIWAEDLAPVGSRVWVYGTTPRA